MLLNLKRKAYGKPPLFFAIHKRAGNTEVLGFQPKNLWFKKTFCILEDSIYHTPIKQKAREVLKNEPDGYYVHSTLVGAIGQPLSKDISFLNDTTFLNWSRKCVVV